jgi:hypothetical protein
MKKFLLVFSAISAMAACAAAASPQVQMAMANAAPHTSQAVDLAGTAATPVVQAAAPLNVACEIKTAPTSHGMAISAVLHADRALSGGYELVVTKSGASGSSDVTQSGAFDAVAGESVQLGGAEIGLERGDSVHAMLTLTDANGNVCRQELRS